MSAGTVLLHRILRTPPERIYRAMIDPDAMCKWSPPHGFTGRVLEMNAEVGGIYRMHFTNFSTGSSHAFGGRYLEMVPGERLRYTDAFEDSSLPGTMETTIELKQLPLGSELSITQTGIPSAIPVDSCYLGWQESMQLLAQLVEPEIPDHGPTA